MDIGFTVMFSLDILFKFLIERDVVDPISRDITKENDIIGIATIYLKGSFWVDLITVIPFSLIFESRTKYSEFFQLIKVLRLRNITKVLSSTRIISLLRKLSEIRVEKMIEHKNPKVHDKNQNQTFIAQLVYIL